jgi:hypothetical protein
MIFWNMKYLFYNCQLLLLCCACCKFAIQAFVQEDRHAYKQNLQKDWQFYRQIDRRLGTRRYYTESCKTITEFCYTHRRLYRRTRTHRYYTESCKKITEFYHTHRRTSTHLYFTDSCTNIAAPATITDGYTDIFSDGWRKFQSARLSNCLVGRLSYRQICRRTSKNLEGFLNFWCENQLNTDGKYRRNLMPPPKKYYFIARR